ncbi:hypothetical protein [uncultured Methanobrevibacter sp.]|uniref:hypothetical protein n=1 Tax=uncultured Methanobrevibacter sp. TaxID=253161 RepID=UPI0025CFDBC1|nr:hypothetical protein [uncultured Methanobrevibacter sp.]
MADLLYLSNASKVILDRDYEVYCPILIEVHADRNLTIDGQGHAIQGHKNRDFEIKIYGNLRFENVVFNNLNDLFSIRNHGICNFINCTFSWNEGDRGIISVYDSGVCNILNSTLSNNYGKKGAAISVFDSGVCNLMNSSLAYNFVTDKGGAIYSENKVNAVNCIFEGNSFLNKAGTGGAIYSKVLSVENCSFMSNTAYDLGGAIYAYELAMSNTTFLENGANYGGAVFLDGNGSYILNVSGINFLNNRALYDGGAIYINNTNLDLNLNSNVFAYNNVLWGTGTAVYNCGDYLEIIYNCWDDGFVDFENEPILVKKGSPDIYYSDLDIHLGPSQVDIAYPLSFLQRAINFNETFIDS